MNIRKEDGTMTRVLLKDRLAHKLTRAIASGLYPVGTLLPGEMELMKREGVSRFTVRAALAQLERHGLIRRTPHVGTRVISCGSTQGFGQQLSTLSDLGRLASNNKRRILKVEEVVISKERADQIHAVPGETMIRFTMVRVGERAGEPPVAWTSEYVSRDRQELVTEAPAHPDILMIELIQSVYGDTCAEVRQTIEATKLPAEPAEALHAKEGEPALRILRRYFDPKGKVILITVSYHPGERYAFNLTIESK